MISPSRRKTSEMRLDPTERLRTSTVFSQAVSNSTYYTGLALLNPAGSDANVKIEVHDSGGALLYSRTEFIPARQRRSRLLTEYFPALDANPINAGYIRVMSDNGIASFALFGTRALSVLSAVPQQVVP